MQNTQKQLINATYYHCQSKLKAVILTIFIILQGPDMLQPELNNIGW